ncbi:hypothetical protein GCM10009769_24940 [Curtobacterium luteum]|nr:hypothetical protein GCM10009769_24940 [Curtobacterium luteum]
MRFLCAGALLTVAVLLLGACASNEDLSTDPDTRLAAAKRMTQIAESKAIALLPDEGVARTEQLERGTLLSCSNGYQWSGAVTARLKRGVFGSAAQQDLARSAEAHGFTVSQDRLLTGRPRYELIDSAGVQLLVTVFDGGTVIDIDSASPCIRVPDDFRPPAEY